MNWRQHFFIPLAALATLGAVLLVAPGASSQTSDTPLTNWAWNESAGWISLHCSTGGPADYIADQPGITATGGTITDIDVGGVPYRVHRFTSSGTFAVSSLGASDGTIEYLVVGGGGGGGGQYMGGGGGGGGVLTGSLMLTTGSKTVTVGAGGAGGTGPNVRGSSGGTSVFDSISALGGGGGGSYNTNHSGLAGGSGGGASGYSSSYGSGTSGQGNQGGAGATYGAGGGGGAASAGLNGDSANGAPGGAALASTITGATVYYGGGGGGGAYTGGGGAGGFGGGAGASYTGAPGNGTANTGGGGGGANGYGVVITGGGGGSGVVIVRYPLFVGVGAQTGVDICDDADYGLTYNTDGTVTGWAWSDNVGWIKFGGLSGFPTGGGTEAVNVQFDENKLIGWARACSATENGDCTGGLHPEGAGWDGWIYLGETTQGGGVAGDNSGLLSGYAWGGGVPSPNAGVPLPSYTGDESSNNNHAARLNMAVANWITGRDGQDRGALPLDGANDHLRIGPTTQLPQNGAMTISLWVRPTSSTGIQHIVSRNFGTNPNREMYLRINAGFYQIGIWHDATYEASYAVPPADIGNWVHLTAVYTGTAWVLYRNGVQVASVTTSVSVLPPASDKLAYLFSGHKTK